MKVSRRVKVTYAIIVAFSIAGFIGRFFLFERMGLSLNLALMLFSLVMLPVLWEGLRFINNFLARYYTLEQHPVQRIILQIILGASLLYSIRAIGFMMVSEYFPLEFNWAFRAAVYLVDFLLSACINIFFFAYDYFQRWKKSIDLAERLEREKTQVQFDNLRNQLNPHFLFNALTSLNSLIFTDQKLASEFLQHMSRVYRYVLQHKQKELVSLQTELDFISNYIFLLQTRFRDVLRIDIRINPVKMEMGIVPVATQILIENAVKHNVLNKQRPLLIELYTEGDFLIIRNNLQRKTIVELSNKQGLDNLKNLYRYLSPLNLIQEEDSTHFYIKIPLIALP